MEYLILRPTLWYVKGEKYTESEMKRHFKDEAFQQLIDYGYIQEVKKVKH